MHGGEIDGVDLSLPCEDQQLIDIVAEFLDLRGQFFETVVVDDLSIKRTQYDIACQAHTGFVGVDTDHFILPIVYAEIQAFGFHKGIHPFVRDFESGFGLPPDHRVAEGTSPPFWAVAYSQRRCWFSPKGETIKVRVSVCKNSNNRYIRTVTAFWGASFQ